MLNSICIAGRLSKDPELRTTQNGVSVTSFTVAVERDFAGQGQQREVDWFDCVAWRQGAEFVSKWFRKGDMIIVTGRMQARDWTDKDGNKRRSWEIQVDRSYFGGSKSDSQNSGGQSYGNQGGYAPQGQYGAAPPQQNPYNAAPPQQYGTPPQQYGAPPQQRGYQQPQGGYQQPQGYQQQGFTELDGDDGDLPF